MKKRKFNSLYGDYIGSAISRDTPCLQSEKLPSYLPFYVGDEMLRALNTNSNHLVTGRRGTGKTHLFGAFQELINGDRASRDVVVMVSALKFAATPPNMTDESISFSRAKYAREMFQEFLAHFSTALEVEIDQYVAKLKRGELSREVHNRVVEKQLQLINEVERGSVVPHKAAYEAVIRSDQKKSANKRGDVQLKASLISGIGLRGLGGIAAESLSAEDESFVSHLSGEFITKMAAVRRIVLDLVNLLSIGTLYILIDEWMEIDKNVNLGIQPYFAQLLKMSFFNEKRFSVKIASVWGQTDLYDRGNLDKSKGVELGDDIELGVDLDTAFLRTEEQVYEFFTSMLFKRLSDDRVAPKLKEFYRNGEISPIFITELFDEKSNFKSIIAASHGIPRRMWNIFHKCAGRIKYRFDEYAIDRATVCAVAREIYLVERRRNIEEGSAAAKLWQRINQYMERTKRRWFLVPGEQIRGSVALRKLVDEELIHQVPSAIVPRVLRDEYKAFHIDFGNYIDWIETNHLDIEDALEDKVLPNFGNGDANTYLGAVIAISDVDGEWLTCPRCRFVFGIGEPVYRKFGACPRCAGSVGGEEGA